MMISKTVLLILYLFAALCISASVGVDPEPYVYLTQTTYRTTKYIEDATVGSTIITIPIVTEGENKITSWSPHFSVYGFFSDNFAIGRRSGAVTIVRPVQARSYNLRVTCLIYIVFANGTQFQNRTMASFLVIFNEGISFRQPLYTVVVDVDAPERSVLIDLGGEEQVNTSIVSVLSSKMYSRTSYFGFGVRPDGKVYAEIAWQPRRTYTFTVFLAYKGVDYKGNAIEGSEAANIRISTQGCRREDGGSHVWPIIHPCGVATANCSEYDDAFENYGLVRRTCTREGNWLSPDFSQCRLKENADPFALVWMTFTSLFVQPYHLDQTITVLQGMFEGVPVKSINFHHSKRSQVRYGLAESYKVTFNSTGPFTDDILSKAWQTLNKSRAIGRRYISNLISSFGVLGFTPASRCAMFNRGITTYQFQPVCRRSGGEACNCQEEAPFQPDQCCTMAGRVDKSNKTCTAMQSPVKSIDCTLSASSSVKVKMYPTSRSVYIDWDFRAIPDTVTVVFTSKEHQGQVEFAGGAKKSNGRISGMLPSTIYTVSVRGECSNDASIPPTIATNLLQTKDDEHPVAPFQLCFQEVSDCGSLKTLLDGDAMQESLVSLLSNGCLCKFNSDRIGGLQIECLTQTSAILRGWIYGEGADPATKYTTLLQQSADNKAVFTLGQQKLTMDPTCPVAMASPSSPSCGTSNAVTVPQTGVSPVSSGSSGASMAGTVVGIIIGIVISVLLALILLILILKFRGGTKKSNCENQVAIVSFPEAGKSKDDEEKLQEDF